MIDKALPARRGAGRRGIAALAFLLIAAPAFSQNAEKLDELLATRAVSWEQAAWFVLNAAIPDGFSGSPAEAFRYAAERKWLPAKAAPSDVARLDVHPDKKREVRVPRACLPEHHTGKG